ncbi:hypothetical protein HD806DRAFT_487626 [Xylariaceae sp. AK1471]|nr:hypothetical protein HD806DRAFT_487626 [Xylariaceae sp. AK1471]
MLSFNFAQPRDVESLQNWLDNTGCLAREESAYLTRHRELVSLAPAGDNAMVQLEAWVEGKDIRLWPDFQKGRTGMREVSHQADRCRSNVCHVRIVFISGNCGIQS